MPRASFLPEAASEDKCRQEERQYHKAWMKLDYFSLKYLSEPGEGGERGRQRWRREGGVRIHSCEEDREEEGEERQGWREKDDVIYFLFFF